MPLTYPEGIDNPFLEKAMPPYNAIFRYGGLVITIEPYPDPNGNYYRIHVKGTTDWGPIDKDITSITRTLPGTKKRRLVYLDEEIYLMPHYVVHGQYLSDILEKLGIISKTQGIFNLGASTKSYVLTEMLLTPAGSI